MAKEETGKGLQYRLACLTCAQGITLGDIDPMVIEVDDRPGKRRHVLDRMQLEPGAGTQVEEVPRGEWPRTRVPARGKCVSGFGLHFFEIAVLTGEPGGDLPVGSSHVLGAGRAQVGALPQCFVKTDQVCQCLVVEFGARLDRGEMERVEERGFLRSEQGDLQRVPPIGRAGVEKLGEVDLQSGCDLDDQVETGLLLPVLEQGQIRGGPAHRGAELVESHPTLAAVMTKPTAEDEWVQLLSLSHLSSLPKDRLFFSLA